MKALMIQCDQIGLYTRLNNWLPVFASAELFLSTDPKVLGTDFTYLVLAQRRVQLEWYILAA